MNIVIRTIKDYDGIYANVKDIIDLMNNDLIELYQKLDAETDAMKKERMRRSIDHIKFRIDRFNKYK